jgi:hypothetical protein
MARIPEFKEPGLTRFLIDMNDRSEEDRANKLSKITANHSLLLQSPSGKVYEITISDAGALVYTLISDTTP